MVYALLLIFNINLHAFDLVDDYNAKKVIARIAEPIAKDDMSSFLNDYVEKENKYRKSLNTADKTKADTALMNIRLCTETILMDTTMAEEIISSLMTERSLQFDKKFNQEKHLIRKNYTWCRERVAEIKYRKRGKK